MGVEAGQHPFATIRYHRRARCADAFVFAAAVRKGSDFALYWRAAVGPGSGPGSGKSNMLRSDHRILTTHVGSLPRDKVLTDLLIRRQAGEEVDAAVLAEAMDRAVRATVAAQLAAGIDIASDGEQQRVGFQTYIPERMSGFGGESKRKVGRDFAEVPELIEMFLRRFPARSKISNAPQAIGEVRYRDSKGIEDEIRRFQACASLASGQFAEMFMTAPSPGIVATTMQNAYYETHEAYLMALARELRPEYLAIHRAGLLLQIDAPDLAMERTMTFQDQSDREFLAICELHMAAINTALGEIPKERVRLHCCWGNWEGPHIHDIALAQILPVLYQAHVGALTIEFANPRHQHEYAALRAQPLPKDWLLIPGVIDSTTNFVEHPHVVARRLLEAVQAVGDRERVIASTDCGFGTFAGREWVAAPIVWKKLEALRRGAAIASSQLWG
jgi:5-methyltetrahydropteroyltriglutamate--homocysteine methyltransferase